jgi:serine/threonine protein kinase
MREDARCPRCGDRVRPERAAHDLCSACVLDLSLPREADPTAIGTMLPQLTILNVIGEGPRAHAYLARFAPPDEGLAAVKRMKPGRWPVPWDMPLLRRVLQLDHAHVGAVFDAGLDSEGRAYSVGEYAPGLPITAFCRRHALPASGRAELLLQATDALQYAHSLGLLHLNLKPSNIVVLQGAAAIKLLDLEAAMPCRLPALSYRAPEQARDGAASERSDVYSLGKVLLELLEDAPDAAAATALRAAAERATEQDPAARFEEMEAFALAIATALDGWRPAVRRRPSLD